jgi:hypothetical protein
MRYTVTYIDGMITGQKGKKNTRGNVPPKHVTAFEQAPEWAQQYAKTARQNYDLLHANRGMEPDNDVIKERILETKKSEKNFREYGRFLNREGSTLRQLNQPAFGLGVTIKLHHELIAVLEGMLAANRAPDFFISHAVYNLVDLFEKGTDRPHHHEVGIVMKEVFKDVLPAKEKKDGNKKEGDPAEWVKKRVARWRKLIKNEAGWKKARASFDRLLVHNPKVNPPLKADFSKPMPFTVEALGDGKSLIQPKPPDADPSPNTITLKARSLPQRRA